MVRNAFLGFSFLWAFLLVLSCASSTPGAKQSPERETSQAALSGEKDEEPESPPQKTEAAEKPRYERIVILEGASSHRVRWGDTLSKLAVRHYGRGNGYYFPLIMLASQGAVRDPDKIIPGRTLTVPDLRRNLNNPESRQMLKDYINEVANIYAAKPPTRWSVRTRNQLRALASTL